MKALLFGLHMHQPTDNLPEAVERAVKRCYAPLFATLRHYPEFRFSLHCSGWLFAILKKRYPQVYADIAYLYERGSIEFFTAGYYEPILASIPYEDRITQIAMLSNFLKRNFGATPRGAWLTERVWDESVVECFKACGIDYTVVDDYHFLASGFDAQHLDGYYLTESGGQRLALFPISKELRYAIPFAQVEDAIAKIADKELAIIFDDAEKFGLWPQTHQWVYEKGWLERFIQEILEKDIPTLHFSEAMQLRPKGLAYLANVSYYEMGEWSLRAKDALELEKLRKSVGEEYFERTGIKFIRGGIWKNFFVKYEESNRLHKRMLRLGASQKSKALYKLQTNDVYWHGIFGGLYLPNLRDNAYRYVAKCEKNRSWKRAIGDEDLDGYKELALRKKNRIWRFYEKQGGQLIELLDIEKEWNFQNTLTRRYEAYHEEIFHPKKTKLQNGIATIHNRVLQADERVKASLHYDWYTKNSFIDHITDESFNAQSLFSCSFNEYGDFANQPFRLTDEAHFIREGGIYHSDTHYPTTLQKSYTLEKKSLHFRIAIDSQCPYTHRYALECNLHFASYEDLLINEEPYRDFMELRAQNFTICDPFTGRSLRFSFEREMECIIVPLQTVSQNERGYEITMQGITLAFVTSFCQSLTLEGSLCLK